jgi:hypothetical protein
MTRLLLLSILVASVVMPSFAAKGPDPRRGLAKLLVGMAGFSAFYWLMVVSLTPQG